MDLLNRVIHNSKGLEMMQRVSAGTVHLVIAEIDKKNLSQLKYYWEVYSRILASLSVVIIIADQTFAEHVIMSNTELFRYRIGMLTSDTRSLPNKGQKELFVFTGRVPSYKPNIGYGMPCYQKIDTTGKQADRVNKGLVSPINVFLSVDGRQTQTIKINNTPFPDQRFSLLRWLINNFSNFGDVVCSSNPLIPYAAVLEGRQFISIVPERKGTLIWEIDLVDFWTDQMSLL